MAVTYGFYNSINKDRMYNAIQMSQIFDGVINDGIYMSVLNHFAIRAGSGMGVIVGGGRAWFNHTWTYNDSDMILNIDESEFEAGRIDAVTIKIDHRESGRVNTIEVVKGTPSDHPVKPTLEDGNDIYYHPLAYVTVNAGVTEITDANIENCIGIDERTQFVTGIIDTISAADLVAQWEAEWTEWNDTHRQEYLDWVSQQEIDMENWETTQKESFLEWMANEKSDYESWLADSKAEFDDWFANLHYILDGDVAAHLQNEIDDLHTEINDVIGVEIEKVIADEFEKYYDLINRETTYQRDSHGDIIGWSSTAGDVDLTVTIEQGNNIKTFTYVITDGEYTWTKTSTFSTITNVLTESYTKEANE